jgi:hypothetical protein
MLQHGWNWNHFAKWIEPDLTGCLSVSALFWALGVGKPLETEGELVMAEGWDEERGS